jgi:monoamine oxidase
VYDEPFWRADGLNGQATSIPGPINIAFDNSPPDGTPGVLLAFAEGAHAVRLGALDAAERRGIVLRRLAHWFGNRAARPVDYHELDWSTEEWTRGCYGAHLAPGVWTRYGPALRRPVGLIHWAGTETSPIWNGYLDGAVRSGQRAADEVGLLIGTARDPSSSASGRLGGE